MRKTIYIITLFFIMLVSCTSKQKTISVLQLNIWNEASMMQSGFEGLVDVIVNTDPDIVLLSEVRNNNNVDFIQKLTDTLAVIGNTYYGLPTNQSAGIISKHKISGQILCCNDGEAPIIKAYIDIENMSFAIYSAHLDYTHYECYLPRGYSGTTWNKIDEPISDANHVLELNRLSQRDESIELFIKDAENEIKNGRLVILGGDFNEPSHLDWQHDTKDIRNHNGLIINWDCSVMLTEFGMIDCYRHIYPNAVEYPGFTFPSPNNEVSMEQLVWAPDVDERDRIDFIYYYPNPSLELKEAYIVGPAETIIEGAVVASDSKDIFIQPSHIWPSDHKGNLSVFKIKTKRN